MGRAMLHVVTSQGHACSNKDTHANTTTLLPLAPQALGASVKSSNGLQWSGHVQDKTEFCLVELKLNRHRLQFGCPPTPPPRLQLHPSTTQQHTQTPTQTLTHSLTRMPAWYIASEHLGTWVINWLTATRLHQVWQGVAGEKNGKGKGSVGRQQQLLCTRC